MKRRRKREWGKREEEDEGRKGVEEEEEEVFYGNKRETEPAFLQCPTEQVILNGYLKCEAKLLR